MSEINEVSQPESEKQTVYAPQPDDELPSGAVISVDLGIDEEVEWIWTHLRDGRSIVTGYKIREKVEEVAP